MQQLISNSNRTLQRYIDAMETLHRVDNTQFKQTVSSLQLIISSHQPLKKLIYDDIVNPVTSLTNTILSALKKTAEKFVNNAVNIRTSILVDLSACYDEKLSFIVQSLSNQLDSLAQDLSKIQMTILIHDESELESLGGDSLSKFFQLIKLLKNAKNNIGLVSDSYCPTNLLSDECARMFDSMYVSLQDFSSTLFQVSNLSYPSDSTSIQTLVYVKIRRLKQGMKDMSGCLTNYSQILSQFQTFLADFTISSSATSGGNYNNLLTVFNSDGVWLENLLKSYLVSDMSKQELADQILNSTSNQLLTNVQNVMTTIDQSVIVNINSYIASITTQATSKYAKIIEYLSSLQDKFGRQNLLLERVARNLTIWRTLLFAPDTSEVS